MPRRSRRSPWPSAWPCVIPAAAAPSVVRPRCDPFTTTPDYDPDVRPPTDVLGFDFGERSR